MSEKLIIVSVLTAAVRPQTRIDIQIWMKNAWRSAEKCVENDILDGKCLDIDNVGSTDMENNRLQYHLHGERA